MTVPPRSAARNQSPQTNARPARCTPSPKALNLRPAQNLHLQTSRFDEFAQSEPDALVEAGIPAESRVSRLIEGNSESLVGLMAGVTEFDSPP